MQKTLSVNISGQSFFIDEEAHQRLSNYLTKLEKWFGSKEGGQEIISDIESRLAEVFAQKINPASGVITLAMVDEAITAMGQPEQFEENASEPQSENKTSQQEPFLHKTSKKLYRDVENHVFGGVCAGLAAYLNIDIVLVRIVVALIALGSAGSGFVIYLILWAVVDPAITTAQKLEMRGENINIQNIEKTIRDEEVKKGFASNSGPDTCQQGKNFLDKMNPRDRTLAIIVLIVIGILLMSRFIGVITHFHFLPWMFPFPLFGSIFWIIPVSLVIIGIYLIFRKNN
jgi:phage shock protein PspC (stress-responsive transcriptional regulator)